MPKSQDERRANFIIRHADQYEANAAFRAMVDSTIYLTEEQKHESMAIVGDKYGWEGSHVRFD